MKNEKEADFHVPFHVHLLFYYEYFNALSFVQDEKVSLRALCSLIGEKKTVFIENPLAKLQSEQAELF